MIKFSIKSAVITIIRNFCHSSIRRFLWKRTSSWKRLKNLTTKMRKKNVITVAFQVLDLACWKCDSIFQLMLHHPRFRPIIWIIPEKQIKDKSEQQQNLNQMLTFFSKRQYEIAKFYTLEEMRLNYSPDIVFLSKPASYVTPWNARNMEKELICYVPYCFQNTKKQDFLFGQENYIWRNFYTTDNIKNISSKVMLNGACNVKIVGSPVADNYLFSQKKNNVSVWKNCNNTMKKIIWAPHWSIENVSWFSVSTFLEVAEGMLLLAEKYANQVQWAFKPHPLLRDTLYQNPNWGKTKTDAYYERWSTMPNTQFENGDYVNLFKQSDAMVHDSGSFIMEYLLVNKPCMYLIRKNGFKDYNADTLKALACYHKGTSTKDVEDFILNLINDAPDTLANIRTSYKQQYLTPPHGKTSAQLIVDEILNGR